MHVQPHWAHRHLHMNAAQRFPSLQPAYACAPAFSAPPAHLPPTLRLQELPAACVPSFPHAAGCWWIGNSQSGLKFHTCTRVQPNLCLLLPWPLSSRSMARSCGLASAKRCSRGPGHGQSSWDLAEPRLGCAVLLVALGLSAPTCTRLDDGAEGLMSFADVGRRCCTCVPASQAEPPAAFCLATLARWTS